MGDNARKTVYVWRRRPELSREEAQRHWREQHAPLVRRHAKALGIVRYVQTHTVESTTTQRGDRPMLEAFDGVAEIWIDSESATGTPEERQRAGQELTEDEARFIDFERSSIWTAEEHAVIEG